MLLKSDEARVPMQDPNRGIPMAGDTMADDGVFHLFLLDRLEYIKAPGQNGFAWDAQGWIGGDLNRLWLKSQGTRMGGETEDASAEVLWAHAFAAFWDWQAGVRRDFGAGPGRTWAAFGVQGLAPYWFDVEATAYVSSAGRLAARAKATYDIRFSQRVVLTPEVEANLYAKDDPARSIGSGLSDVRLGARLRYEVQRNVAPYIGVSWGKRLGKSADYARAAGRGTTDKQVVVGLRMWF
ncbi:copper resistance protein B [Ralstonia mannitolilytica]|uniref:copper resistance protein B n=1 Tax=Ralstonia mannitolilytica TaxID=105219 RepID=UPI003B87C20B